MKKITSLTLGFSFLIMTYTGVMLFICPHGKVAYWNDWHFWGLTKNQYGDIHTTSMLVFVIFGLLHIYYNWKAIVSYLKDKQRNITFTKKEFVIALLINLFFIVGTLTMIQPFKGFLGFEDSIKESWIKQYSEPPYGHAEESKLKVFCKKINLDLNKAKERLKANHIVFDENDTLKKIAKANHTTPSQIYMIIKDSKNTATSDIPSRLGRKTLQELADLKKINLEKSLKFLTTKGLKISKDDIIKNIADELDMTPLELYKLLKNKK